MRSALQGAPWKFSSSHMKVELAKTLPQEDAMAKIQDWMDGETKMNAHVTGASVTETPGKAEE